jgi:hypothetical protein
MLHKHMNPGNPAQREQRALGKQVPDDAGA